MQQRVAYAALLEKRRVMACKVRPGFGQEMKSVTEHRNTDAHASLVAERRHRCAHAPLVAEHRHTDDYASVSFPVDPIASARAAAAVAVRRYHGGPPHQGHDHPESVQASPGVWLMGRGGFVAMYCGGRDYDP